MGKIDIESILASIKDEVERRRADGSYPPGLEQQLEAEFARILALTHVGKTSRVDDAVRLVGEARMSVGNLNGLADARSKYPPMALYQRIVRRMIARQTKSVAAQARAVDEKLVEIVEILTRDMADRDNADARMVVSLSKHVLDRVAVVDHLVMIVRELETKVRALEGQA